MEKRRIRLEINGVVCGLITQESEEYMQSLAGEVGEMMKEILAASPFVTREAAALTAALSYADDAKKNGRKAFDLQERVDELEVEAEIWQEDKEAMLKAAPAAGADPELAEKLARLEEENTALQAEANRVRELEERAAALEDENSALQTEAARVRELEQRAAALEAAHTDADGELERKAWQEREKALEEENARLRNAVQEAVQKAEAAGTAQADGEPEERLARLEADNGELRRAVQEQEAQARKAEEEKQAAVSAAKRAVEEARKVLDQVREEAEQAKEEVRRLRERGTSPALDLLERTAEESGDQASLDSFSQQIDSAYQASTEDGKKPETRRKRKNPLRHEEDFEQEGFVSFFEKK